MDVRTRRVLNTIGGASWYVIAWVAVLAVLVGVLGDASAALVRDGLALLLNVTDGRDATSVSVAVVLSTLVFFGGAVVFLRIRHGDTRPRIDHRDAGPSRVLILFVSLPPRSDRNQTDEDVLKSTRHLLYEQVGIGSIEDGAWRKRFERMPWRIPCEAIAHQLAFARPSLERVVLVPSARTRAFEPLLRGFLFDALQRSVDDRNERSDAAHAVQPVVVADLAITLGGVGDLHPNTQRALADGLDYEDIQQVFDVLYDLYRKLSLSGYSDRDVLIDVTSGRATNSVAGAIFGVLTQKRRFAYVSDEREGGYTVRSYDVTYAVDDLDEA